MAAAEVQMKRMSISTSTNSCDSDAEDQHNQLDCLPSFHLLSISDRHAEPEKPGSPSPPVPACSISPCPPTAATRSISPVSPAPAEQQQQQEDPPPQPQSASPPPASETPETCRQDAPTSDCVDVDR